MEAERDVGRTSGSHRLRGRSVSARAGRWNRARGSSTRSRCGPPRRCRPPHAATAAARKSRAASGTSSLLNIPDASWTSHPRSARRSAFDRTPRPSPVSAPVPAPPRSPCLAPAVDPAGPARTGSAGSPARELSRAALPARAARSSPARHRCGHGFPLTPGLHHGGGLGSGHGQSLDELLPHDHPPIQLDLGHLQRRSRPGRLLPQILAPLTGHRLPRLQLTQHRRHTPDDQTTTERRNLLPTAATE